MTIQMGPNSIFLLNPLHGPKDGQAEEQALGWRYLPYVDVAMVDDFDRAANILDKSLGAPKGPAIQEGWTFRREFEHAMVFVDVEQRVGTIDWKVLN